jgi:2'-5' RNA ligase
MQKFTQKYTIVCLLEDIKEGYEYPSSKWPLHITLADTFSIDKSIEDLEGLLDRIAASSKSAELLATHNEFFGPNQDIKVTVYEKSEDINRLHYNIVEALQDLGVVFNDPQYTKDGFKPHSTVQNHAEIKVGDKVRVNNLAIVDMFPDKDPFQRKILKKVSLK